jgi:hypothetical protein
MFQRTEKQRYGHACERKGYLKKGRRRREKQSGVALSEIEAYSMIEECCGRAVVEQTGADNAERLPVKDEPKVASSERKLM